ncbi:hypothetical protein KXD40_001217 [Peronospora effusa]|uniref:Uncharacterized protein n=1 Tax=Peronospora effusa TaxID=542832 RepID=A0A3M6VHV8_9STRA|nr:hypothetical protein DD238_002203 [Peronospora effusa]RQM11104.1 hypothetical protein DD237_008260 [Peronospora effusa]UIZ20564.1 hypothetical protein KXD40_001217 [Peronospora effusa]CAI5703508.1 unnamed protein product [Peronospora effusa]
MSIPRNDFLTLWKLSRTGDEAKIQEHIEESDAVARNLVNLKHHRKGTSPLMEAASSKCNEPVVAQLIAAGADVNDVDDTKLKNTALHYAAMTNVDPLTIEALLEAGADAFAINRKGFTPLDVARQSGRKTVGAALLDHMKVHAGWLFLRGKFHWKKRWAVVVACNKQRTSTELCIFRRLSDLRPSVVMLIDEAARMIHFSSTDSYSWLQRDNAFVFDKPVMCHYVKREKFTRAPICRKTMSLVDVETVHCVFAADSLNNLAQWRRVLESSNFYSREDQTVLHRSSLFDSQNGELYYWPHELVENLRTTILQGQEQEREQANDPLYQRLHATTEERRTALAPASVTSNELAPETVQTSIQPPSLNKESIGASHQDLPRHTTPTDGAEESVAMQNDGRNRVHFAPPQSLTNAKVPLTAESLHTDVQRTESNVSVVSGSDGNSDVPGFVTGIVVMNGSESQESQWQQNLIFQDKNEIESEEENNQKQHQARSLSPESI